MMQLDERILEEEQRFFIPLHSIEVEIGLCGAMRWIRSESAGYARFRTRKTKVERKIKEDRKESKLFVPRIHSRIAINNRFYGRPRITSFRSFALTDCC